MSCRAFAATAFVTIACACTDPLFLGIHSPRSPNDAVCPPEVVPTNTAATADLTGVWVSWESTAPNDYYFVVEENRNDNGWLEVGDSTNDVRRLRRTPVERDQKLAYRVRARNQICISSPSPEAATYSLPKPVSALSATTDSNKAISLTWTDSNEHETGFRVERRVGATGTFEQAGMAPPNATGFADEGLDEATDYEYRVSAVNGSGDSEPATTTGETSRAPILSWGAAPTLDVNCNLTIDGTAAVDTAHATIESIEGTIAGVQPGNVTASVTGLSGVVTTPAIGAVATSWRVTDSLGVTTTLNRNLVGSTPLRFTATNIKNLTRELDNDAMQGRQIYLPAMESTYLSGGCNGSMGRRASILAGLHYGCTLMNDSSVKCWGWGSSGELGDGTFGTRGTPAAVCETGSGPSCTGGARLTGVVGLAGPFGRVCALKENGTAWCWGNNSTGGLGDGTTTDRANPVAVCRTGAGSECNPLTNIVSIAAGLHSCAVLADGTVRCWGQNSNGEVGDGTQTGDTCDFAVCRLTPTPVCTAGTNCTGAQMLSDVVAVTVGAGHTCALLASSHVKCWGRNDFGQAGIGTTGAPVLHPTEVCASGTGGTCVSLTGVYGIAAGTDYTCAVMGDGHVKCWGYSSEGGVGDGAGSSMKTNPVDVCVSGSGAGCAGGAALTDAVAISAGGSNTCALVADGTAYCWGLADKGAIGHGSLTGAGCSGACEPNARKVCATGSGLTCNGDPLTSLVAINTGYGVSCALGDNDVLKCWGNDQMAGIGDGAVGDGNGITCGGGATATCRPNPVNVCNSGAGADCTPLANPAMRIGQLYTVGL